MSNTLLAAMLNDLLDDMDEFIAVQKSAIIMAEAEKNREQLGLATGLRTGFEMLKKELIRILAIHEATR